MKGTVTGRFPPYQRNHTSRHSLLELPPRALHLGQALATLPTEALGRLGQALPRSILTNGLRKLVVQLSWAN